MNPERTSDHDFQELDPDAETSRRLVAEIADAACDWLATLPEQPTFATEDADAVAAGLREEIPEEGGPLEPLLRRVMDEILPCAFNTASGGYLALRPRRRPRVLRRGRAPRAPQQSLRRRVGRRTRRREMETQVLRWLAAEMGMPEGSLGVMTTGGSTSNLIAVVTAREKLLGEAIDRGVAYVSTEVHGCVDKALRIAGIPDARLRRIPVDAEHRLDLARLQEAIDADRTSGLLPFFVVGSAGTVNTGAIDPLDGIAALCRREELWFHVDGAYGAAFHLVPELRPRLAGPRGRRLHRPGPSQGPVPELRHGGPAGPRHGEPAAGSRGRGGLSPRDAGPHRAPRLLRPHAGAQPRLARPAAVAAAQAARLPGLPPGPGGRSAPSRCGRGRRSRGTPSWPSPAPLPSRSSPSVTAGRRLPRGGCRTDPPPAGAHLRRSAGLPHRNRDRRGGVDPVCVLHLRTTEAHVDLVVDAVANALAEGD